jgi:hypothetical protein
MRADGDPSNDFGADWISEWMKTDNFKIFHNYTGELICTRVSKYNRSCFSFQIRIYSTSWNRDILVQEGSQLRIFNGDLHCESMI